MEECEGLDSDMTELQDFQCDASEAVSQDDEDEVEELQNSLREVVQDQSVKPKLQCLMVDPSFSMVTVQSEDSGIVWETASSRCSTPWASETSSISEGYSMEGSGAAGKITIVFDEEKIVRRRTRSGRSSRLGDRLSRPGSSRSASALGVERPEMAEVSLPNVKQEKTETEPDLEEIKNKDQQLFSLISEGYEILNIRVPSKLPTVDEEETTELQDNLSYLDQTPKIKSRNHQDWTRQQNHILPEEDSPDHKEPAEEGSPQPSADTEISVTPTQKESSGDIDYFEKFTLVDVVVPGEQAQAVQEEAEQPAAQPEVEEKTPAKETAACSPSASEESFVIVTDVDIVGEHLDEVFYGEGAPADALHGRDDDEVEGERMRMRRESQRSVKESGSVLFGSEETILTPIYISPGPPKIIDPILLEEPTAMSFMYSDLYEDAVGERRSDEEFSEAESVASEKSYKRRFSDSEEADGYLEKFTLKDETPTVEVQSESEQGKSEGRMMWSQSKFEMTGCLMRAAKEEDKDETKAEELKTEDVSKSEDLKSAASEEKREIISETVKEREEIQTSTVTEELPVIEEESIQESKVREDQMEDQEVKHEVKRDQTEPPESRSGKPLPETQQMDCKVEKTEESEEHQSETTGCIETEPPCHTQITGEKTGQVVADPPGESAAIAAAISEEPHIITESETPTETTASSSEEAAADEKVVTETPAEVKEPETEIQETLTSAGTETKTAETLACVERQAAAVAPVEVTTDRDAAVHAVVEVTEKAVDEKEIQTQVQIDLQEVTSAEREDVETAAQTEAALENKSPEPVGEADQESEVKTEISHDVTEPVMPAEVQTDSDKQHQQEESITDSESDKTKLITEAINDKTPAEERTVVQEMVNEGEDLILLVPKGQAVEMNIEMSQESERPTCDTAALSEPDKTRQSPVTPETITEGSESARAPNEKTVTETEVEVKTDVDLKEKSPPSYELDNRYSPSAPVEASVTEEQQVEPDFEEDEGIAAPLRSFTPQEDLSALHREDVQMKDKDGEQKAETQRMEDSSETDAAKEDLSLKIELHTEDGGQKMEADEAAEVTAEEMEYEVISKQDAKEMAEPETQRDAEGPKPEEEREKEERVEMEAEAEREERLFDLSPEEEPIEADYEIIDEEEESQARLAAELEGMDWFCLTCGCLLSEDERVSGEHHDHDVTDVDKAYEEIKEKLSDWISELQERSENIEDLVSEIELAYNSVEDQCVESEAAMQAQNEEMMALVMEQYNSMSVSMEEEKKAKLEQLYDQIVSFQESIDSAKATLETTAREAETDARSPEDIHTRLEAALDSAMSLELGPKGLLVFEDYAKGNTSSSQHTQRKGIPVPQRPTLQPQEPGSATSTSVTVYWRVNPGDIIDCFQVYCMEDPQGAVSEEYRVTVKESYCVLEELEPDKTYKVWVMAVNYTGCSLPSERLGFRTAPSVPVIDTERCTIMWDSATLRWSSAKQSPEPSYTLEYCRQYELEGEGLRTISGIRSCEQRVFLQPNENYLFYIKAVNEAGASEQSEAALVSTKGTRFHLLKASAHPALELSADRTVLRYSQDAHRNTSAEYPSILGELLPARGLHYWETVVSGSAAFRLGVAYSAADRNRPLGEDGLSWCLQCIPTPSGCRFQLLHNGVQSSVFVVEMPERVGALLDYQLGRLSFYNARSGQVLGAFCQHFTRPCHPALALEMPGSLEVSTVPEAPQFTKDR